MKKILVLFVLISSYAFSQSVNDYQYVIVPVKFDFLKKENEYGLNTLTKLLLQKYGFKAYLSTEEIPSNIESQRCNFLYADVTENNGIMITKVKLALKDCTEKVLFETQLGGSREKEYAAAYNSALRDAGKSFDNLGYKYNGKSELHDEGVKQILSEKSEPIIKDNEIEIGEINLISSNKLVTETIENGFLLLDSTTSNNVLKILKTSDESLFIATSKTINGVVIKKGKDIFFEYYQDKKLVSVKLNVCCI